VNGAGALLCGDLRKPAELARGKDLHVHVAAGAVDDALGETLYGVVLQADGREDVGEDQLGLRGCLPDRRDGRRGGEKAENLATGGTKHGFPPSMPYAACLAPGTVAFR